MSMHARIAALALLAITLVAGPVAALEAETRSLTVLPVPPPDPRNSYIPPQGATYIVNNLRGEIVMCYPDSKDGKFVVTCTPSTKLFSP
jgi:hypothetical protein